MRTGIARFALRVPLMPISYETDDLRIRSIKEVSPPAVVHSEHPITEDVARLTYESREATHKIVQGNDDRLLVIIGPCSIHDPFSALEYAQGLAPVRARLAGELEIVMRVYFEKPRTTVGWKGLINDPALDDSFKINRGLRLARQLLLDIGKLGVPAGTEYLDLITPQYVSDAISWGAIGARTTESQVHRELASGLSCAVGFKNGTDGTLKVAIDAVGAALRPHHFLSLTKNGHSAIFTTAGNDDAHIILRGGRAPNYDAESVAHAAAQLEKAGLANRLMVDFSHANSAKDPLRQLAVAEDVGGQLSAGSEYIMGVMVESHLLGGRQDVLPDRALTYGQSITDACLGWDDSVTLLEQLAESVKGRRATRSGG